MEAIKPTDREATGRHYMALAIQHGSIELIKGLSLYTTAGLEALGAGYREKAESFFPSGAFYFITKKTYSGRTVLTLFECCDPLHVIDCMEEQGEKAAAGKVLPFTYTAADNGAA